jgi:hypothetical protein
VLIPAGDELLDPHVRAPDRLEIEASKLYEAGLFLGR